MYERECNKEYAEIGAYIMRSFVIFIVHSEDYNYNGIIEAEYGRNV